MVRSPACCAWRRESTCEASPAAASRVNSLRVKGIVPLWNGEYRVPMSRFSEAWVASHKSSESLPGVLKIQLHFIHITPSPPFTGLDGAHHRVLRVVEMLSRVLAYGAVAAAHVSTDEAH